MCPSFWLVVCISRYIFDPNYAQIAIKSWFYDCWGNWKPLGPNAILVMCAWFSKSVKSVLGFLHIQRAWSFHQHLYFYISLHTDVEQSTAENTTRAGAKSDFFVCLALNSAVGPSWIKTGILTWDQQRETFQLKKKGCSAALQRLKEKNESFTFESIFKKNCMCNIKLFLFYISPRGFSRK